MKVRFSFISILMVLFLSSAVFAQGNTFKYVGAKKCKMCHNKKKDGEQYKLWVKGPHAKAMESLSGEKALKYAKEHGIADPAKEAKCLKCHSTKAAVDAALIDPKGKLTMEEGVSCESCHGPGSVYKKKKIMKDHKLVLQSGLIVPDEKTCVKCHTEKDNPFFKAFDFKKRVKKIAHPILSKK